MHRSRTRRRAIALVVAVLGSLGLTPAVHGLAPTVDVTSVNGQDADAPLTRPVAGKRLRVEGVAAGTSLFADAGDSAFVLQGSDHPVAGQAGYGRGPYRFHWSLGGSSARFAAPDEQGTTFDTTGLEGPVTLELTVTDAAGVRATDSVRLFVYRRTQLTLLDKTGVMPASALFAQEHRLPFTVPTGTTELALELSWQQSYKTGIIDFRGLDLHVDDPSDREDANESGAQFEEPERMTIADPVPGAWAGLVSSSVNVSEPYRLTALAQTQPADPVPTISTSSSPYTFVIGAPQRLSATAAGGSSPLSYEWDLDLDGAFERSGSEVTTAFPLGTHLVTAKVTDASGYERRVTVGVRVVEPGADTGTPPIVVVAVTDTGVNAYHPDFAASTYPDPRVLELTGNFTRHPSEYLPGYPVDAEAIPLTLGQGYLPEQDRPLWTRANVALGALHWMPGTKIVGAYDSGDSDATDLLPILDDDYEATTLDSPGHGTASASVAVGNVYGYCPTCLLVFTEDFNGDPSLPYQQDWVDLVSNSYGPRGNVGTAGLLFEEGQPLEVAEKGQIALYAAGNGVENGFVIPEQTYITEGSGPGWVLRVGAAERSTRKPIVGTGKPVDITSWGSGVIPAAAHDGGSIGATTNHSGTSAATPYTAGVFGTVLQAVRDAIDDDRAWQRDRPRTGVVAQGKPVPGSAYLGDGVLTRAELTEAILKSAEHDSGADFALYPTTTPNNPGQLLVEGYGLADPDTARRAIAVLVDGAPLPDRPAEDLFFAADQDLRAALWGSWSGGENSAATESDAAPQANPFAGLDRSQVPTLEAALELIADRTGFTSRALAARTEALTSGEGSAYFLHHRGGCVDGAVPGPFMDRANTDGDDDGCGAVGTAGITGSEAARFPSAAPVTDALPADSLVEGVLYLQTDAPAPLTVVANLFADGQAVGTGTSETVLAPGLVGPVAGVVDGSSGWLALPLTFETSAPIVPGQSLELAIALDTTASWYFGFEGDHASGFTITPSTSSGGGPGDLAVAITDPASGASIDPAATPDLAVTGTATFPASAGEGTTARYYPHWVSDGTATGCGAKFLDQNPEVQSVSCSATLQALAPTGIDEFRESYPLDESSLPIRLGPPVSGTLYYRGLAPVHAVTVELRANVDGVATTLGSQSVEGVVLSRLTNEVTAYPYAFEVPASVVGRSLDGLSLDVVTDASGQAYLERNAPASYVDLTLASVPSRRVEVSVDDPTFASAVVATSADDGTWGAVVPMLPLADGPHVLYARAVQDGTASPTAAVAFEVRRTIVPGFLVQLQVVPEGAAPTPAGWSNVADASGAGDYSRWVARPAAPTVSGRYQLVARLLRDGVELHRDDPVTFVR